MKFIPIDKTNIDLAISIQHHLFPEYNGEINYRESLIKEENKTYFLIEEDGNIVGITGLYFYKVDPTSAWLGWFGILEEYRRLHLGSKALKMFEEMAKEQGFKTVRLYTDKYDNKVAINFYKANGYTEEDYVLDEDPASKIYPLFIFSKSLDGSKVTRWNNKNIGFTKQTEKQVY